MIDKTAIPLQFLSNFSGINVPSISFLFLMMWERMETAFAHSSAKLDAGRGLLNVSDLTMLKKMLKKCDSKIHPPWAMVNSFSIPYFRSTATICQNSFTTASYLVIKLADSFWRFIFDPFFFQISKVLIALQRELLFNLPSL
jgi:hypothetical protein